MEPLKLKGKCFGDGLHKSFHCKNAHDWISNRVPSWDSGLLCPCVCVCVCVRSRVIHFAVTLKSLLLVAGKSTKALSIGLHGKSKTTICKCLEKWRAFARLNTWLLQVGFEESVWICSHDFPWFQSDVPCPCTQRICVQDVLFQVCPCTYLR